MSVSSICELNITVVAAFTFVLSLTTRGKQLYVGSTLVYRYFYFSVVFSGDRPLSAPWLLCIIQWWIFCNLNFLSNSEVSSRQGVYWLNLLFTLWTLFSPSFPGLSKLSWDFYCILWSLILCCCLLCPIRFGNFCWRELSVRQFQLKDMNFWQNNIKKAL